MSKRRRRTISRRLWWLAGAVACAALGLCMLPSAALAQGMGVFDPSGVSQISAQADGFFNTAQGWAQRLFTGLFVIELTILGVQGILFRDNLAEFMASFGLKVFAAGFFMWLIVNAQTFLVPIRDGFKHAGQSLGGSGDATPFALAGEGLLAATGFYTASMIGHSSDYAYSWIPDIYGALTAIVGQTGLGSSYAQGHQTFGLMMQGIGLMMIMASAGVIIQTALVTIESAIVMGAGVMFLGFSGTRFTMPFSQGYLQYAINVGVKLFTLYIVVGLCQNLMPGILAASAITMALGLVPAGLGSEMAVPVAAWAAMQMMVVSALIWAIPNFAGSFLSGTSSLGAGAIMGQFSNALQSMQQMRYAGALQNQFQNQHTSLRSESAQSAVAMLGVHHGAEAPNAAVSTELAAQPGQQSTTSVVNEQSTIAGSPTYAGVTGVPGQNAIGFASTGSQQPPPIRGASITGSSTVYSTGGNDYSFDGEQTSSTPAYTTPPLSSNGSVNAAFAPPPSAPVNHDLPRHGVGAIASNQTPESIRVMKADEFRDRIVQTDWKGLDPSVQQAILDDPEKRRIALEHYQGVLDGEGVQQEYASMMGMGGLRGFMTPPPEAPVGGVQIRLNNPDKL
ncbi:MAG: type IV secretion system protein [Candidatus Eremiobacteraeota bacterium]|nr:type IV secretion system protein [Candidatus Eremiobacteraeota bacterium]